MNEVSHREVEIGAGNVTLSGTLAVPSEPRGVVLFAHGSGSGRFSPRNQAVAVVLQEANLATLLMDLLSEVEARDRRRVFDIPLLAERLSRCASWIRQQPDVSTLSMGYFGASTGAGAALLAAAHDRDIRAVVSRGGRPDLAGSALKQVQAPALLIVGGRDEAVIELNESALEQLRSPKELVIVPGATHLFEERGALERVAALARDWFLRYLPLDRPISD